MTNKEAIEVLEDIKEHPSMSVELSEEYEALDLAIKALERPQGEWEFDSEYTEFGNPYGTYKCSCCGGHSSDKYPYCFWCGAKMKGGAE